MVFARLAHQYIPSLDTSGQTVFGPDRIKFLISVRADICYTPPPPPTMNVITRNTQASKILPIGGHMIRNPYMSVSHLQHFTAVKAVRILHSRREVTSPYLGADIICSYDEVCRTFSHPFPFQGIHHSLNTIRRCTLSS
jgi:hypothetical protein